MRALITGVTGFAGSHLAEYLLAHTDLEVWGTDISSNEENIAHIREDLKLVVGDMAQPDVVSDILTQARPDHVYHLAAQAFVPVSWRDPWQTIANNVRAQLNILQAMISLDTRPRVLVVGSPQVFAPLLESRPGKGWSRLETPVGHGSSSYQSHWK